MEKAQLKKLITIAGGKETPDLVIKNVNVVNVFSGKIEKSNIAISDGNIAGVGDYDGENVIDGEGLYAVPSYIDSHIHIESSYVCPEEIGKLLVPHGTSTIIADPHEIVNVCGIRGLDYMMEAGKRTALDIRYMLPSCVPATPFENAGAIINAPEMEEPITRENILGLGEFMNAPGVVYCDDSVLDKLMVAKKEGKLIDGHAPGLSGLDFNAYCSAGILADHECSTVEEMEARINNGLYVLMRQGSACHNLATLLKGVTNTNSRRCLLCSDDRQPKTILEQGHLDNHLQICVKEGIDPVTAIQMATINAAECFGLKNQGAIAPGYRADITLIKDLKDFEAKMVILNGELVAKDGEYLLPVEPYDISSVKGSITLKDFSKEKFKMNLKSNHVHAIEILPGGVVTGKAVVDITLDNDNEFVYEADKDIVKVAVVERHKGTGNVACAFLKGYGIKKGAVAVSIAHDSHNIIVAGVSDEEMEAAVLLLEKQEGGVVLVRDGKVVESMPLPIAGLMSDQSGEWVKNKLVDIHNAAYKDLEIEESVDPVMTLCFMSLPVIPELKLTDEGLFDVTKFGFISVEAED